MKKEHTGMTLDQHKAVRSEQWNRLNKDNKSGLRDRFNSDHDYDQFLRKMQSNIGEGSPLSGIVDGIHSKKLHNSLETRGDKFEEAKNSFKSHLEAGDGIFRSMLDSFKHSEKN